MRRRLVAFLVVACLAFAAVVARLVYIQGVSPERYLALGESQRLRSIVLPAERGAIFDRNGRELALSLRQRTVWGNPHEVTDPAAAARALAPVLGEDEAVLRNRLTRDASFVYLARKVPDDVARRVEALGVPGVSFVDEPQRFLPAGSLALPLLGMVGLDNDGLAGLELQYDKALAGRPGQLRTERDPTGQEIAAGDRRFTAPQRGDDLVLTIDRSLQYQAEKALADEMVRTGAKGGIVIVMNPRNGDVLAMANLEAPADGGAPKPAVNNMAVTNLYEPGSVNKVITVAAALEEDVHEPFDELLVPDKLRVANHTFSDHDPHPPERWTVTDILANSSNVGTIMLGQELGKHRIDRYLKAFGFGRETGLGFPGEPKGLLLDPDEWSGTSIGTIPIGQGVAVTALQMLAAYNTVANGGVWVEPRIVSATVDGKGEAHATEKPEERRVVSSRTARRVTAMLTEVVRAGTGTSAAIDGYTVAGKTGTARKPLPTGGYRDEQGYHYVASFAGFVPAESPQLSAIVVLDEPTPIYGGLTSAPVFARIAQYALRQLRIPPASAPSAPAGVPKLDAEVRPEQEVDVPSAPPTTVAAGRPAAPPTTASPPGARTTTTRP